MLSIFSLKIIFKIHVSTLNSFGYDILYSLSDYVSQLAFANDNLLVFNLLVVIEWLVLSLAVIQPLLESLRIHLGYLPETFPVA